jgi:membrane protein YqaA with SNARE-associated domain
VNLLLQSHKRRAEQSLASTLGHLGAAGLFFFAILDSSPLPTFGGADILTAILAASHRPLWYEYGASATAGSVVGAYLTFRLARKAGAAYLDRKFKKSKVSKFHRLFQKWGTGTLVASAMVPLPTPTSMLFAAAGVSDYPRSKFVGLVGLSRGVRYFGIAFVAGRYGRHFLRVLRHPVQHWSWFLLFLALTGALIAAGIILSRRLETGQGEQELSKPTQA